MSTLCVIDMQPYFTTSEKIIKPVVELVKKQRRAGCPVILVEYSGYGPSSKAIKNSLKGYKKFITVTKDFDGGGDEVIHYAKLNKISLKKLIVCGVNTCYCVYDTVLSIVHDIGSFVEIGPVNCSCNSKRCLDHFKLELLEERKKFLRKKKNKESQ